MTANTSPLPPPSPLAGVNDVLRSEFCKLRSLRSTYWMLSFAIVSNVVLAAVIAIVLPSRLSGQEKAALDSVRVSLAGLHLSQLAFGALGVLVITSEYGSGMIRASLAAVPRRRLLLAAKALVFTATALIIGVLASFAAYFAFQTLLSDDSLRTSVNDPGVLRAVIGGGLFLTVLGLLGLGLGAILRSSAGAVAALFGLLFVPSILAGILPQSWQDTINPYLPMNAGEAIYLLHRDPSSLSPWSGFGVFCLYATTALAIGFLLITHRDA